MNASTAALGPGDDRAPVALAETTAGDELAPARSWRGAVSESLRLLGLAASILLLLLSLWPISMLDAFRHPPALPGLVLLWLLHAVATVALLRRWRSKRLVLALVTTLVASCALMVSRRHLLYPGDLWAPGMWAIPVLALALQSHPRRDARRGFVAALACLLLVDLSGPVFFWQPTAFRLLDVVMGLVEPLVTVFLFGDGMLRLAERHDAVAAKVRDARISQLAQTAETEGRREAARVLHDHVLHALHAVSESRSLVAAPHAVEECRNTLDQLERPSATGVLVRLDSLLDEDPVLHRVSGRVHGTAEPLPCAVANSLASAAHEALVNVERHARAKHCVLRLESFGTEGCRVTITDDGRGFDTSRNPDGRLGLQRSVFERLHDIGGRARVDSTIGQGTTVVLEWPVTSSSPRPPQLAAYSDAATRRMLVNCALPGLLCTLLAIPLVAPKLPHPELAVGLSLASLLVALRLALQAPRRGISNPATGLLLSLTLAAWVANLMAIPRGWTNVYYMWMAWGGTAATQVAMLSRSKRETRRMGYGLMTALVLGVLGRFSLYDAWQYQSGAIVAGGMIVVIGYRVLYTAQDIAAQSGEQDALAEQTHLAVARMHELARLDQFWSDRVTSEALPLIRGVAQGTLDVGDDDVRRWARSTESLVRDELVLGPEQPVFRERLAALRAAGWVVNSSLSRDDGSHTLEAAARLALLLGPARPPGQMVTLSAAGGAVTAVVLSATDEQIRNWHDELHRQGGTMDTDPDFVRLALVAP